MLQLAAALLSWLLKILSISSFHLRFGLRNSLRNLVLKTNYSLSPWLLIATLRRIQCLWALRYFFFRHNGVRVLQITGPSNHLLASPFSPIWDTSFRPLWPDTQTETIWFSALRPLWLVQSFEQASARLLLQSAAHVGGNNICCCAVRHVSDELVNNCLSC